MKTKDIREIDKNMKDLTSDNNVEVDWYEVDADVINKYLMGKALKNGQFNRLNDTFVSENVEWLKWHTAGENLCFNTSSSFIKIKANLPEGGLMPHMTAVGTIGFSLYVLDVEKWKFLNSTKTFKNDYEMDLVKNINHEHSYRLYFPLYQRVNTVSIGVEKGSSFNFYKLEQDNLLIYGTSISQGGCASRPGMDYGAILGRIANLNVINLGFSGSCKVEREILDVINQVIDEQNLKYIIFELEANSPSYDHMSERFSYYMEHIHNKDNIKIYLVSHYDEAMPITNDQIRKYRKGFKKVQKDLCKKYNINFIDGNKITKKMDCDGTVDGAHLTDLGFYVVAQEFKKIIMK